MPLSDTEKRRLHQRVPTPLREGTVADPPLNDDGWLRVEIDGQRGVVQECPWVTRFSGVPEPEDAAAVIESDGGNYWALWWPQNGQEPGGGTGAVTQEELDAAVATLEAAIAAKQDAAGAATDAELAAAVATLQAAVDAKQDASSAATDAELAAHVATQPAHGGDLAGTARPPTAHTHDDRYYTETEANALLAAKQDAATAATDAELAAGLATKADSNRGMPAGGADGEVLTKTASGDYAVAWEAPPAGGGSVARVTALPASPVDGQRILFEFGTLPDRFFWELEYDTDIADAQKWVPVGLQRPLRTVLAASGAISVAGWNNPLLTLAPVLPLRGLYLAKWGLSFNGGVHTVMYEVTASANGYPTQVGAINASPSLKWQSNNAVNPGSLHQSAEFVGGVLNAGWTVRLYGYTANGAPNTIDKWLELYPLRLG